MNEKDFIKVVNNNQFEIKAIYNSDKDIKKIDYNINIYFFIPKNLNINATTYTKDNFYSEHVSFIRLLTPKNELGILKKKFNKILNEMKIDIRDERSKISLKNDIKLLLSSYVSYIRAFSKQISNKTIKPKRLTVFIKRMSEFQVIKVNMIKIAKKNANKDILDFVMASAEYLSLSTQHYLLKVNIELNSHGNKHESELNQIVELINSEISFCKNNEILVISNNDMINEKVIFRYSILKKFFYSALYLYPKRRKDGVNMKEFYYAIAAGISMIFTTLVVFATQSEYGNFTTSFFVALVVSYMFKDRIKEGYRHYFDKRLDLQTYDFKEKIYNQEKTELFAFLKEKIRFNEKENVSKKVIDARLTDSPIDILSALTLDEEILKYEKNITIYNNNIQKHYKNTINGINNIMRFDISKFLTKMANEKVPLYKVNSNKMYGNKVYHVNIVLEFATSKKSTYHKARLILNKSGIKRIEIPKHKIKIFAKDNIKNTKHWIKFKKSGFVKKQITKAIEKKEDKNIKSNDIALDYSI